MDNANVTGTVFDIQHFAVSDGPGIRTVVFFKGCPLRCTWCHNPESFIARPQVMTYAERCGGCGACVQACPQKAGGARGMSDAWREVCVSCGSCAKACPAGAIEMAGRTLTVAQVMREVQEDVLFYASSGGGITLSGGEPMAQPDFALALARSAKEAGLHVCMETSGYCSGERLLAMAPWVDLFLFDYKLTGVEEHRKHTGVSQTRILENLRLLDDRGARLILRCPMIPGVNITGDHVRGIIRQGRSLRHLQQIHLEPYHKIGLSKRIRLGMDAEDGIDLPDRETLKAAAAEIKAATGLETLVM